jgi:hypothetical protein
MVRVIFARRHHLGSALLRTALWSPWSHVGIISNGYVIHAAAGQKVAPMPLDEFKAHASEWAIVEFPADPLALLAAHDQIGTPYDMQGVIGLGLHRRWQDADAWFCSELVAYALEKGGLKLFRADAWRITPQHLWMLNYPIVESAA